MIQDVPSRIDLRLMSDAQEWEATAMSRRPWRTEFFAHFASAIATAEKPVRRVLELGSGPGFLAEQLLRELPGIAYVALDFSSAMHELAAKRLALYVERVQFITRSFKGPDWQDGLGSFDCVVTNQAVHELRHKAYAQTLHAGVRKALAPSGLYLVCDHIVGEGGMTNDQLYMTVAEQRDALLGAGFTKVRQLFAKGSMVLHEAK